jgi:hypothetical protein
MNVAAAMPAASPARRKNNPIAKSDPSTTNNVAGMRKTLLSEG